MRTLSNNKVCSFLATLIISFASSSCAPGVAESTDAAASEASVDEDVGTAQQAVTYGWTLFTSEEYPPIGCDNGSLMNTLQCSGRYCDNIRTYCTATGGTVGASSWTSYFSEEGTSYRMCAAGSWVTGLSCTGKYCDNVSLQCTQINGITAKNCYWTGWVSEENGGMLDFGASYYMRGAQCSGSYCDNMRFLVCQK